MVGKRTVENIEALAMDLRTRIVNFVNGERSVKEIERLIAKLKIDKEILADSNGDEERLSEE